MAYAKQSTVDVADATAITPIHDDPTFAEQSLIQRQFIAKRQELEHELEKLKLKRYVFSNAFDAAKPNDVMVRERLEKLEKQS